MKLPKILWHLIEFPCLSITFESVSFIFFKDMDNSPWMQLEGNNLEHCAKWPTGNWLASSPVVVFFVCILSKILFKLMLNRESDRN